MRPRWATYNAAHTEEQERGRGREKEKEKEREAALCGSPSEALATCLVQLRGLRATGARLEVKT